jgi:tetratricopeptide (TPR) repeat protein/predicted aspartyl protease
MKFNLRQGAHLTGLALTISMSTAAVEASPGAARTSILTVRAAPAPVERTMVKMPFVPLRGHGAPIVRVEFPNHIVGHFMIDTGASFSCMTDKFAKTLRLKSQPAFTDAGGLAMGSDHGNQSFFVRVPTMDIGMTLLDSQFILINSHEFFDFGEESVDGMIGGSMLKEGAIFIDYPHNELTIILPGGLSEAEVAALGMGSAGRVPLRTESHDPHRGISKGHYLTLTDLTLESGGKSATEDIMIDTGAPNTSVSQDVARKLSLRAVGKEAASTMGDGSIYGSIALVPKVTLGSLTLTDFKVEYPGRAHGADIPPLLGEDILSYCAALFDFSKDMLYLKPVLPPLNAAARTVALDPRAVDLGRLRTAAGVLPGASLAAQRTTSSDTDSDDSDGRDAQARIAALKAAMTGTSADARRWDQMGDQYRASKQNDRAHDAYRKSVEAYRAQAAAKPGDATILASLSGALTDAGNETEGETFARTALAAAPHAAAPLISLGWALHIRAVRLLTGAPDSVTIEGEDLAPFRALVNTLQAHPPTDAVIAEARRLDGEALAQFDRAVAAEPDQPKPLRERASFRVDSALAIDATARALKGEDVNVLGLMQSTGYVDDLQAAADRDPNNIGAQVRAAQAAGDAPFARNERGIDLREQQYWDSLPRAARKSVDRRTDRLTEIGKSADPKSAARATEALALVELDVKRHPDAAAALLDQALKINPTSTTALFSRAQLLREHQQFAAIESLFATMSGQTDSEMKQLWLCYTAAKLHNWDRAQESADAAVRLAPDSYAANLAVARISLRRSYEQTDVRLARAKSCIDRLSTLAAESGDSAKISQYRHTLALYHALHGEPEKARDIACECLIADRSDTEARDILGAITP